MDLDTLGHRLSSGLNVGAADTRRSGCRHFVSTAIYMNKTIKFHSYIYYKTSCIFVQLFISFFQNDISLLSPYKALYSLLLPFKTQTHKLFHYTLNPNRSFCFSSDSSCGLFPLLFSAFFITTCALAISSGIGSMAIVA